MGLVDDIKNQVKKSGTNKSKFLYFKSGTKVRVRFLDDMEDGHKIRFHDSFTAGVNVPCQETFDRECPYCDDDELRTRDQYAWTVWDYDAKEVKILMAPVNQCSPVPALVSMYEAYGTLCDRDYVITKSGQQQSTTFSVVPMDKAKFRNEKAKPLSETKFLQLLDKAGFGERDFLFVLGDVIDRGEHGVELLRWISRQPNVQLILGNHEAMMLACSAAFPASVFRATSP